MTTPLLRVRDLEVDYGRGARAAHAVRGVSLDLQPATTTALVGESGSGKSTLAHALIGLLHADGRVVGGSVDFDGVDLTSLSERRLRRYRGAAIGLVPQDPTVSLNPVTRVGEQIAEAIRIHGRVGRRAAAVAAIDILRQVGIDSPEVRYRQYPHELSGGMRQRVLIGIAVACSPRLIIADEPTSALDVTVQRTVLDHLSAATTERGTAVLLITHDLGVAAERADRIVVMHRGVVVEEGPTHEVIANPRHPYTRTLLTAAPSLNPRRLTPSGIDVSARARDSNRKERTPAALAVHDVVRDFSVRLPDGRKTVHRAVDGVSLSVAPGTTHAIVGESGSGKSTLARLSVRLLAPDSGRVEVDGVDLEGLDRAGLRDFRSRAQLVYQNPFSSLNPRFTVAQIIGAPLAAFGRGSSSERKDRVLELLDQVALAPGLAGRSPAALSGGQRQRVAIARALALNPALLVLDEPVSALDVSVQSQILQLLVDLQADSGLSYLFITHDLAVVRQVADEVSVMRAGRVLESGRVEDVFTRPGHDYTIGLLEAIPGV